MSIPGAIQKLAAGVSEASSPMRGVYGILVKLEPLTFKIDMRHELEKEFLIFPKGTTFTDLQIGTKHLFLKDLGGQDYYYLYEVEEES